MLFKLNYTRPTLIVQLALSCIEVEPDGRAARLLVAPISVNYNNWNLKIWAPRLCWRLNCRHQPPSGVVTGNQRG